MEDEYIEVSFGVTRNAGNYESIRLEETMRVKLTGDTDAEDALDKTMEYLEAKVDKDASRLLKAYQERRAAERKTR